MECVRWEVNCIINAQPCCLCIYLRQSAADTNSNYGGDTDRSKDSSRSFVSDYYDDAEQEQGKAKDKLLKAAKQKATLALCTIEQGISAGKALFFVRTTPPQQPVDPTNPDQDLTFGEVNDSVYEDFVSLLSEVYYPVLGKQEDWGKAPPDSVREFVSNMGRYDLLLAY